MRAELDDHVTKAHTVLSYWSYGRVAGLKPGRSLGRRELLRGPLYYVLVLIAATLVFWRDSPVPTHRCHALAVKLAMPILHTAALRRQQSVFPVLIAWRSNSALLCVAS